MANLFDWKSWDIRKLVSRLEVIVLLAFLLGWAYAQLLFLHRYFWSMFVAIAGLTVLVVAVQKSANFWVGEWKEDDEEAKNE